MGTLGLMERCLLHLCAPLSFLMALKHRLDRTDGAGRVVLGPGGPVWLDRGEDFGGKGTRAAYVGSHHIEL